MDKVIINILLIFLASMFFTIGGLMLLNLRENIEIVGVIVIFIGGFVVGNFYLDIN